ncbi:hypothetical protein D9M68_823660 [compost metagenome]
MLQQVIDVLRVFRVETDAQADGHVDRIAVDVERVVHGLQQALGCPAGVIFVLAAQDHGEFVGAQARQGAVLVQA